MSAQFTFCIGLLVAVAMSWSNGAIVHARERQEKPRETPPAVKVGEPDEAAPVDKKYTVVVQPDESAPVTRKYTNVFDPLEMQGFSVALLLGEVEGGSTPDNLPAGATKALADVREFLPYKSYRLLDTQWIRCCASSGVQGRLRGLDEQHYTFHIGINTLSGQKMTSTFSLASEVVSPLDTTKRPIIASNFSMETGETVVIGTSSLKGNRALVVLLTAVPRSTTSSKVKKGILK
jgi:hypothetical protein